MDPTRGNLIKTILFSFSVLFVLGLLYLGWLWPVLTRSTRVSVVTATLGVLGTLSLATATFWTIQQNNRLIEERAKERERPLAKEELEKFIDPSIAVIESNISAVEDSEPREWIDTSPSVDYSSGRRIPISTTKIQFAFQPEDVYLSDRVSRETPKISKYIEDHDEKVKDILDLRQKILQEVREDVKKYLQEEHDFYSDPFGDEDMDELLDAIFKRSKKFGNPFMWNTLRENLIDLLEDSASEELNELDTEKQKYIEICECMKQDLENRKKELMSEYGIVSEFDSEEMTRERM